MVPTGTRASLSRDETWSAHRSSNSPGRPGGATQTIGADAASPPDAELLGVPVGSPTLVVERDHPYRAASPGPRLRARVPAHRMTFSIDVPLDAGMLDPAGMKVVTGD
ncbi:MAG: UTRA domain-containing protein [Microthrixaceae bacterium]